VELVFSDRVRSDLLERFVSGWMNLRPDSWVDGVRNEAEIFVSCLECVASRLASHGEEAPAEQSRKEKLEAFANALERLIDAMGKLDDLALGHALMSGLQEAASLYREDQAGPVSSAFAGLLEAGLASGAYARSYSVIHGGPAPVEITSGPEKRRTWRLSKRLPAVSRLTDYSVQCLAYDLQTIYARNLAAFSLGVRLGLDGAPAMDKGGYSAPFQVARWLEDYLGRIGLFSTSDTGLAGVAFSAVLELSGAGASRANYWLRKAKESEGSWSAFVERSRDGGRS